MFRRLGIFAAGFDLNAAHAVSSIGSRALAADLIGRLTDKSLLSYSRSPEGSRWQMLGAIRLYALDRLAASGEEPAVREAHLDWAAAMADDLERRLEKGQQWRTAFDLVADDLRAALITATSSPPFFALPVCGGILCSQLSTCASPTSVPPNSFPCNLVSLIC